MVELDYIMITALIVIGMLVMIREANDMLFMYYQHISLPVSLPIP